MILGISSNFTMSYRCLSIDIFLDLGKFTGFESFRRWLQTHAWAKIELLTKWKDRSTYSRGLYTFIIHLYILCILSFLNLLMPGSFNLQHWYWWRFFQQQPFHVGDPVLCDLFKPGRSKTYGRGLSCWHFFLCEGFEHFWKKPTRLEQIFWSRWWFWKW